MAEPNVTTMVIKVDLQCEKCYKKIKKVLCKFPEIRDQVYDEKKNTVTIKVVCCNPEKMKQKIYCKGGEVVKGIEIKVPEQPKETAQNPKETAQNPKETAKKQPDPPPAPSNPSPVVVFPIKVCCKDCSEGRVGCPCYHGHVHPPPVCYCGTTCYERCWGCGYRCGYYIKRCDNYFVEENPYACSIM